MSLLTGLVIIYFAFKFRAFIDDVNSGTLPTAEQSARLKEELKSLGIKV